MHDVYLWSPGGIAKALKGYQKGDFVWVYYDSSSPEKSVLFKKVEYRCAYMLFFVGLIILVIGGVLNKLSDFVFLYLMRSRNIEKVKFR